MGDCVYFESRGVGAKTHTCQLHEQCKLTHGGNKYASCDKCNDSLSLADDKFPNEWIDPLYVIDRFKHKTDSLRNLLAGRPAFLFCGGPSALEFPLEHLDQKGTFTLAVNNAAGHSRFTPQAFVCSDPPMKFSHSIWLDPKIMKLVPTPKMSGRRDKLRMKKDKVFSRLDKRVRDCPNVWGFKRESWLEPDDRFFLTSGACWGNQDSGTKRTGQPKTVCTMLLGLRLLRYLGASRIYLLGVDFRMGPGCWYSFSQGRTEGACESNNRHFSVVNGWLCQMQSRGVFERYGVEIFNCFSNSGLRAFPHVPFDIAIRDARGIVEDKPDLEFWYEKESCPKCDSWHVWCENQSRVCKDCEEKGEA